MKAGVVLPTAAIKVHNENKKKKTFNGFYSNLSIRNSEIKISRNARPTARGGGVAKIIRQNISHQLLSIVNLHICYWEFRHQTINYAWSNWYTYTRATTSDGIRKQQFASDILRLSSNERYLLGGDLSSRHRSWGCIRVYCWENILNKNKLEC